ncbi:MAG: glycosyl hydrolase [Planctomycetota bacterium]
MILTLIAMLAAPLSAASADELERGFKDPPDSARPWVYWFWMDGNLSREGITADLEAMQRAGIGGVIIMEVDVGIPKGPVRFMSAEWRALFKHVAAEAARLGLEIDMNASPGWTGSGGPWIEPEQSMQKLVFSETEASGPGRFEALLPSLPMNEGFYRDVSVLAFPTPASGALVPSLQEKALFRRGHYSSELECVRAFPHRPDIAPCRQSK